MPFGYDFTLRILNLLFEHMSNNIYILQQHCPPSVCPSQNTNKEIIKYPFSC